MRQRRLPCIVRQRHFEDCAHALKAVLDTALASQSVQVHSLEARAKTVDSFARKAARPLADDPEKPKYSDPLSQITDLAGIRVITFFLDGVDRVSEAIEAQFDVVEKTNKSSLLAEEERLGYQSVHYLAKLGEARTALPEYARFRDTVVEIQVRTILQHAWAEIEHDIQYKSVEALPAGIRRRFLSLAGLLEIGDREFQAIAEEERKVRLDAGRLIQAGRLVEVEVTPDALKIYLDRKLGADGRMGDWNYGWYARMLKRLGFCNLQQVDNCISPYDDDKISRLFWGSRQGQLQRFEDVLVMAMGGLDWFWSQHPYGQSDWFQSYRDRRVAKIRDDGLEPGAFDPRTAASE